METIYNLVEVFNSIQGEGWNFGRPVTFVRFSFCNLNCHWCDTDWKETKLEMTYDQILNGYVKKSGGDTVIVTGGEPTDPRNINKFLELTNRLINDGYRVCVETNGTCDLISTNDVFKKIWISASPKLLYKPLYQKRGLIKRANEVRLVIEPKYNVDKQIDAIDYYVKNIDANHWYLSPCEVGGKFDFDLLAKVYQKCQEKYGDKFKISIQLHKLMGVQ